MKVEPIRLKYEDGTEYTLEFNRKSVAYAEQNGFSIEDVAGKLMTRVPELFHYAFRMHHPNMRKDQTDAILFNDLGGLSNEQIEKLIELYGAPYETLINDSGESKNSKLTVVM